MVNGRGPERDDSHDGQLLTDANVRLIIGLLASVVLLALIVIDATSRSFNLETETIYLLTGLIWSFLGIDVMSRASRNGRRDNREGRNRSAREHERRARDRERDGESANQNTNDDTFEPVKDASESDSSDDAGDTG